jgi:DNA-binding FadR family transcriptional regulator
METTDAAEPHLRVPKMAELVSQRLRRQIIRGDLSTGDALPSESALMARFGVSRPTLREAFRVLESEGLITVRRGAHGGARVQVPNADIAGRYAGLLLEFRRTTLADVYNARILVEPPCAALLAERCTPANLERLRQAIERERDEDGLEDAATLIRRHSEFHDLVVELTGNKTMSLLHGMVRHFFNAADSADLTAVADPSPDVTLLRTSLTAHRRLLAHVIHRDADAARELWTRHVAEAESYLLGPSQPASLLDLLD